MAVASAVGASLLVIDADVVVPVGVHESLVAVAKRGSLQDGLASTRGLIDTWASLEGGRAIVLVVAVAIVPAFVMPVAAVIGVVVLGFDSHFGLAKLGWNCSNLLKVDGSGGY